MSEATDNSTSQISAAQHEIADLLMEVVDHCLKKNADKKRYITLDGQLGKSKNNKNAISVLRNKVSFMVEDWTLAEKAAELGLANFRKDTPEFGKTLLFSALKPEIIRLNEPFFQQLSHHAKAESARRQTLTARKKVLHGGPRP